MTSASVSSTPEAATDEKLFSPMDDSTIKDDFDTPPDVDQRQARQHEAITNALTSSSECELFWNAITDYMLAGIEADELRDDESVLLPVADLVEVAAKNAVAAAADFHCAKVALAIQKALLALDMERA